MSKQRKLPDREHVFIMSLMYHGFRLTRSRSQLKYSYGYIVPATNWEDAGGIDAWVKMPRSHNLLPIQVTQRGDRLFRKHGLGRSEERRADFRKRTVARLRAKRTFCQSAGIVFVLVADFDGRVIDSVLASSDVRALRLAMASHQARSASPPAA